LPLEGQLFKRLENWRRSQPKIPSRNEAVRAVATGLRRMRPRPQPPESRMTLALMLSAFGLALAVAVILMLVWL
jgi:hypothetical protein